MNNFGLNVVNNSIKFITIQRAYEGIRFKSTQGSKYQVHTLIPIRACKLNDFIIVHSTQNMLFRDSNLISIWRLLYGTLWSADLRINGHPISCRGLQMIFKIKAESIWKLTNLEWCSYKKIIADDTVTIIMIIVAIVISIFKNHTFWYWLVLFLLIPT